MTKSKLKKQIDEEVDKLVAVNYGTMSKRKAKYLVLDAMFDDLPDGAYFAAMAEFGFEAEDIIALSEEDENGS